MPLDGNQLSMKNALALCRAQGFSGLDIPLAASVMSAESLRYVRAWHDNLSEMGDEVLSTDYGLFQINDVAHPDIDVAMFGFDPKWNVHQAHKIFVAHGNSFAPWAAYDSGRFQEFLPDAQKKYSAGTWRLLVPRWRD